MVVHTIDTLSWIPFIPSQNFIEQEYNYKSMNLTKPGTYFKSYTNYYIVSNFKALVLTRQIWGIWSKAATCLD